MFDDRKSFCYHFIENLIFATKFLLAWKIYDDHGRSSCSNHNKTGLRTSRAQKIEFVYNLLHGYFSEVQFHLKNR